jgi:hypothetical protein
MLCPLHAGTAPTRAQRQIGMTITAPASVSGGSDRTNAGSAASNERVTFAMQHRRWAAALGDVAVSAGRVVGDGGPFVSAPPMFVGSSQKRV